MGKETKIAWTDSTFNPWWGCRKVSPACENCYAESLAQRFSHGLWSGGHRMFLDNHWHEPVAWNRRAGKDGVRRRVFCGSMCDVFEDASGLDIERNKLWATISETPNLIWLLLTKRPENILAMVPWSGHFPANVWVGATVENQEYADIRIPELLKIPAKRFLSIEPMLGPISVPNAGQIHWIIVGGETGSMARPMRPEWVIGVRDRCIAVATPFFFKSWGNWCRPDQMTEETYREIDAIVNLAGIPVEYYQVGKKDAGRLLDGREWNEFP